MAETNKTVGAVTWFDLTVDNADELKSFYEKVVGWKHDAFDMGSHKDYCMIAGEENNMVAGICHNKGMNEGTPPQWMIYINVKNLKDSLAQCEKEGGKVIKPTRDMGNGWVAIIQDPAGAVCALFEHK